MANGEHKPRRKAKRKTKPRVAGRTGRPPAGTADWRPVFIAALREGYHIKDAAHEAKVNIVTPYRECEINAAFKAEWEKAWKIGTKALMREADRRAYHGTEKPVYQGGKLVGHIREYDNQLLMRILRVRMPEKYSDNIVIQHKGLGALLDKIAKAKSEAELDALEAEIDRAEESEAPTEGETQALGDGTPGAPVQE